MRKRSAAEEEAQLKAAGIPKSKGPDPRSAGQVAIEAQQRRTDDPRSCRDSRKPLNGANEQQRNRSMLERVESKRNKTADARLGGDPSERYKDV